MGATPEIPTAQETASVLHCPRCAYDLTGLPQPRCPECGLEFDWAEVRAAALGRPVIAFERLRGWRRIAGFLATCLCVIILPIRFARQATRSTSLALGLAFGGACFALTLLAIVNGAEFSFFVAWYAGAAVCILLEVAFLTLLDWRNLRPLQPSIRFWLAISGYTSAIVVTEFAYGPPVLLFQDVVRILTFQPRGFMSTPFEPLPHWLQIASWLLSVLCVLAVRLRRSGSSLTATICLLPLAFAVLVAVHCSACWVGASIYEQLR